jgi:nicotinamidase-related amidase
MEKAQDKYETPLKKLFKMPEFSLEPKHTALLVIDMQYLDAHPDYGLCKQAKEVGLQKEFEYYVERLKLIVPNIQKLLVFFRKNNMEIIYTRIVSMHEDGRDRCLIHKTAHINVLPGSKEAEILDELKPQHDELVFGKTCSGVFNGTNIDIVLRNMGIKYLVITGVVTDECVETAVRDASDRGWSVVLVEDGCGTVTQEIHDASLRAVGDVYCKVKSTDQVIQMLT